MDLLNYVLLGFIQGVGEFLPISSSGHLIIVKYFVNIPDDIVLDVTLHLATLLAVIIFYKNDLITLSKSLINDLLNGFSNKRLVLSADTKFVFYIFIACIPTFFLGFIFKDYFESNRGINTVLFMLVTVSIFMLLDVLNFGLKNKVLDYRNSFIIGFLQTFALLPGASRSGITITTASLLGINKKDAARFSFLLSIPAILAAFILSILDVKDMTYFLNFDLIVAFFAAFISGLFSIKLLISVLTKFGFLPFIVYRILLVGFVILTFV